MLSCSGASNATSAVQPLLNTKQHRKWLAKSSARLSSASLQCLCLSSTRKGSLPEDVLVEAGSEGVGQLVTEEAEVVDVEGSPNARPHLPHHLAEHIHKLTLISHLNPCVQGSIPTAAFPTALIKDSSDNHCCQQQYITVVQIDTVQQWPIDGL